MKKTNRTWTLLKANSRTWVWAILAFCVVVSFVPSAAVGQSTTATIIGTITDPEGGQVPNAQITAKNVETGLTRTVMTSEDGNYRIEFLPVGNYSLEVSVATGFKKAFKTGILLQVNDTVRTDFALEIGDVNATVTITDETPQINTSSPEIGRTVEAKEIENLPLVERNVFALLDLTPGVQSNNTGISNTAQGNLQSTLGFPEQRTLINGGTDGGTGSVNYFLDGGTNMTSLRNTGNVAPNPEAVQEFKITTNAYGAEYGRYASGIVNIITKSGTNKFRGSLYEYVRNDAFNANEYGSRLTTPPYKRNQYGGSIGGPLIKDRTFFFGSYSGLRQITSRFLSGATLPTALERTGDFSLSTRKPRDPVTGVLFANGLIPLNKIDPVALKLLERVPLSNATNINGSPGFQGNVPLPVNTDEYLIKIDHQLTNAHRLSGTYFTNWGTQTFAAGSGNIPWATQDFKYRQHNLNLSDVWVIGADKVNQFWVTYTRSFGGRNNDPGIGLSDLGSKFVTQGTPSLPQITISSYFTATNAIGGPTAGTNLYSLRDVFSWTKGNHSIKIGGEVTLNKDIQDVLLNNYGVFTFNGSASGFGSTSTGNGFADFLLGIPSAVSQDAPVTGYTNSWYYALFIQDNFRVNSKLTLDLGLRWDFQTPPTDPLDRWTNYVPGQKSTVRPDAPIGALFVGDPGVERGGIANSYTQFSPRLGFAYDPFGDGKTSIRGAMGLFYGGISGNQWNTMGNFQPASTRLTFTNISRTGSQATLSNPYQGLAVVPFPYTGTFGVGGGFFAVDPDFEFPRTLQMNFSVQRQITEQLTVGAAFVRSVARNLPFGRDVNYPVANATATNSGSNILARRPNPLFGAVTVMASDQSADYEGLQITGSMRFNKRFTFNGFYTLSNTTSSVQLHNNTTQGLAQNFANLAAEKGAADTDQRHVFSMSFNFQPDFYNGSNRILKAIVNGWSISPIVKARSGRPFTVTNNNVDANLDGNNNDRARLTGISPYLANPTAAAWFNTAAFAQNAVVTGAPVDGTSPRNFLYGPSYRVVDVAISRDFRFGERYRLRLRGEGTNIFNMVNLGLPNASVPTTTSTTFGTISDGAAMRVLQFGFRFTF